MADRNFDDPNETDEAQRPTWDLGGQVEDEAQPPDLIDPASEPAPSDPLEADSTLDAGNEDLTIDEGAAVFGDDQPEDIVGSAGDEVLEDVEAKTTVAPVVPRDADTESETAAPAEPVATHQPDPVPAPEPVAAPEPTPAPEPAPAWEGQTETSLPKATDTANSIPHVAASGNDIPRDVLERRQTPEDEYERMREVPAFPDVEPEAVADPAGEPAGAPVAEQASEPAAPIAQPDTELAAGLGAAAGVAAVTAGADAEDDIEATKVRRKSLLRPEVTETEEPEATSSWIPREPVELNDTQSIFEEATVVPEVPSRVGARVWSFFLTLIGVPAAWYLLTDSAARLTLAQDNPVATGVINPAALIELGAGVIVAILVVMVTIRSSLGALIFGILAMAGGIFFLAAPAVTADFMEPAYNWLTAFNAFGGNVAHHIQWTGYTGVMAVSGLILFIIGLTSIFARRDGRREQEIRTQIEQLAPGTLKKK